MTDTAIEDGVIQALQQVAPELDRKALDRDRPLRDQVDIDSYDYLRFVVALAERLGIEIPERDYDQVVTLNQLIDYLKRRGAVPRSTTTPHPNGGSNAGIE